MLFSIAKIIAIYFWILFAFNLFNPFADPYKNFFFWGGIVLLLVHLGEFLMQKKKLEAKGAAGIKGFLQTMLFGLFYWLPILKEQR